MSIARAILATLAGLVLVATILWDAFETIILPRRVSRRLRPTRLFYRLTWAPWSAIARRMHSGTARESLLGYFGPLSLILLLALWAAAIVIGFAVIQWGLGTQVRGPAGIAGFAEDLYVSGTTLPTLGMGDVYPISAAARTVTVIEAGIGLGLLALVIGYLPVLYQSFSRRETSISLLDARAGSPPSAGELLRRYGEDGDPERLVDFLTDWEVWAAELLESHLSYPILAYYRSQHDNQSWLAALTSLLDVCALIMVGVDGTPTRPARLTFAMARHLAADVSQIFHQPPRPPQPDRLPESELATLRAMLTAARVPLRPGADADRQLAELRALYEPYVNALARYLLTPLPPWLPSASAHDDWQTTAWQTGGVESTG
jgi:hypothetical protein